MAMLYQIRVKDRLDRQVSAWFDGMRVTHTPTGDTWLTGMVADQAGLHGLLARCRDLGVTLISVNPLPIVQEDTMSWIHVEASHTIPARPAAVYAVISDYRVGHPAILPKDYFTYLTVEKGGQGAGTVVRGGLKVFGIEYPFHQIVSEPEPGRVLVETDLDTGQVTRFIFEPVNEGAATRLTIVSDFPPSPGFVGFMERLTKPMIVRNIYNKELRQLAEYVGGTRIPSSPSPFLH